MTSGNLLLEHINGILDFSKMSTGKLVLKSDVIVVTKMLKDIYSVSKPKSDKMGVSFSFNEGAGLPKFVLGDPLKIKQVCINLVDNAIKFTEPEGTVTVEISMTSRKKFFEVQFQVTDTGVGIPAEKVGKIFNSFVQIENSLTRKCGGTGLGLSISKFLCEMMGGDIIVTSVLGKGSCFTALMKLAKYVPIPTSESADSLSQYGETDRLFPKGSPVVTSRMLKVLLVEDNIISQKVSKRLLEKYGCEVEIAENGRVAVDKSAEKTYDIIFMDIQYYFLY